MKEKGMNGQEDREYIDKGLNREKAHWKEFEKHFFSANILTSSYISYIQMIMCDI